MKHEFSRQIFEKSSSIKFHENPSIGSRVFPRGRTWQISPTRLNTPCSLRSSVSGLAPLPRRTHLSLSHSHTHRILYLPYWNNPGPRTLQELHVRSGDVAGVVWVVTLSIGVELLSQNTCENKHTPQMICFESTTWRNSAFWRTEGKRSKTSVQT